MLGITKKNQSKPIHEIPVEEWELALDKIYRKVFPVHTSALAIVSNTKRAKDDKKEDDFSEEISFRFKKDIDQKDHAAILKINKDILNNIFTTYLNLDDNKKFDFCHVGKKNGLEKDYVIYPFHKGLGKKAFIVFEFPLDQVVTKKVGDEILFLFAEVVSK